MEENILQVPEFETISRLPNDLHIGFMTTQKEQLALALDPEPSAPGVEPVASPVRIVSADKKALKAGGLAVALKGGAIVSPADEADVTKTYELVLINAE